MEGRSEGTLIILLVVVGILTGLLTAGAVALYSTNDEQDDAIADLRRETASLRSTNEKLFGRLASATEAEQSAGAQITRLNAQLGAANETLRRLRGELLAARRAVREQTRAARRAREQARAARSSTSVRAASPLRSRLISRARASWRASASTTPAQAPAVAPPPPPASSRPAPVTAPVARPVTQENATQRVGGRGRGWGR
ncbi:MAG: hypothetical protein H0U03_13640 [Actinobacteria bacterium]|nr:hypothetical protein [Actinomycetota bacterium]